jgi:hypothetical protein
MKRKIAKISLYSLPLTLKPPIQGAGTTIDISKDVRYWLDNSDPEFVSKISAKRTEDRDMETVAFILEETKDVVIYCSAIDEGSALLKRVRIVSKEDVKNIKEIKPSKISLQVGVPVKVQWRDTIGNYKYGSVENIIKDLKFENLFSVGYLISEPNSETLLLARYIDNYSGKYREVSVIPRSVVKEILVLN